MIFYDFSFKITENFNFKLKNYDNDKLNPSKNGAVIMLLNRTLFSS